MHAHAMALRAEIFTYLEQGMIESWDRTLFTWEIGRSVEHELSNTIYQNVFGMRS